MTEPLQLVTNSRLRVFRRCKREHHYRYGLNMQPVRRSDAIRFGSLFHAALEAWWLAVAAGDMYPLSRAMEVLALHVHESSGALSEFDLVKAEELMCGYDARWLPEARECEVLGVESEFSAPMVNPETGAPSRTYRVGGKLDNLIQVGPLKFLMEHKTTTLDISPGSEYWRRLQIDGQISMYFDGSLALGHEVAGCIYDVAVRPSLKPYKATPLDKRKLTKGKGCKACGGSAGGARGVEPGDGFSRLELADDDTGECLDCLGSGWKEAPRLPANQREHDETTGEFRERVRAAIVADPSRYFVRGEVARLDEEMDEHRWDTWHTAKNMRAVELSGCAVRNPDACVQITHTCDFFDVCTGSASLDDPKLFLRGESSHPELSTTAKEVPANDPIEQLESAF